MPPSALLLFVLLASPDAGTPKKAANDAVRALVLDTGATTPIEKKPLVPPRTLLVPSKDSKIWKDSDPNDPNAFEGLKMKGTTPPDPNATLPGPSKGKGGGTGKVESPPPTKESAPKTQPPPVRKQRGDIDLGE